jgi:hypothetical protein
MLATLLPAETHNKIQVNEKTQVLYQEKDATHVKLGTRRRTKGKDNLFQLYDKYPHDGAANFMKYATTQFGFTFFCKNGKASPTCPRKSLQNMLDHHRKTKKRSSPKKTKGKTPTKAVKRRKGRDQDLYFHKMTTKKHHLSQGNSDKDRHRSQTDDIGKIGVQYIIPVRKQMVYLTTDLHERPHGIALFSDREMSNSRFEELNIPNIQFPKRLMKGVYCSDFMVICPGAPEFAWLQQNVQLDKRRLLEYILDVDKKEDRVRDQGGDREKAASIYLGFGQSQPFSNPGQLCYCGPSLWKNNDAGSQVPLQDDDKKRNARKVPLLNIKYLEKMPEDLQIQLGRILTFGQACLDSYHQKDKVKPFADEFRNTLFGNYLHSSFPQECMSSFRWEYIHISVKHYEALLPKHMDYSNDSRKGYNHCVVYSFTIDEFRISVIMTSRRSCGSASDRIKEIMSRLIKK